MLLTNELLQPTQQDISQMIYVTLGAVTYIILTLNKAMSYADFSFKAFVHSNGWTLFFNFLLGVIMLHVFGETVFEANVMPTKATAFMYGVNSQYIVKQLLNIIDVKNPTKIGFNDKNNNAVYSRSFQVNNELTVSNELMVNNEQTVSDEDIDKQKQEVEP